MFEWFYFILWENTLMKFWTFSFWKCIYKCMILFFECIYNLCLNGFFNEKMHLQNFGLFLFENAFMNIWFFLDLFLFSFYMYPCINFFWECIYKWNFWECMYKILEKCIRDFVNAYIDICKLILFLWKYLHENLFFIFFQIFHFLNSNAWMDAQNCNF